MPLYLYHLLLWKFIQHVENKRENSTTGNRETFRRYTKFPSALNTDTASCSVFSTGVA